MTPRRRKKKRFDEDPRQRLLVADAERNCRLCGRRLRGTQSLRRGYGRRCYRRLVASQPSAFSSQSSSPADR